MRHLPVRRQGADEQRMFIAGLMNTWTESAKLMSLTIESNWRVGHLVITVLSDGKRPQSSRLTNAIKLT